jgi:hypothetical protein
MKPTIENCRDTFKISYDIYESSREEQKEIVDMYHGRHYTQKQLSVLHERGQPKEVFNIVKMYHRMLVGYFSTVVNNVKVAPVGDISKASTAALCQDVINTEFKLNKFKKLIPQWASDTLLYGMAVPSIKPVDSGKLDRFGKKIIKLEIDVETPERCLKDPLSEKDDYSDARFFHTFKWVAEEEAIQLFGETKIKSIPENTNTEEVNHFELIDKFNQEFVGEYKVWDHYLIIKSFIRDGDDTWLLFWCDYKELLKIKLNYENVVFPTRPYVLEKSNIAEIYGPFRELIETQKSINQALLQIQLLVNSDKVMVQEDALIDGDLQQFEKQFNRVNAIVKVANLTGVKIENMTSEIVEQYRIIDSALDRIQKVLNINDAFMGMAQASDSGRKVRLQQNSTITSLNYLTEHIEFILEELGMDICFMAQQFYTSERWLRVTDEDTAERWVGLNQPFLMPTGNILPDGTPEETILLEEVTDDKGIPQVDGQGKFLVQPIIDEDTQIKFDELDITITSSSFNDSDDIERLALQTIIEGPAGIFMQQAKPAAYARLMSLYTKSLKSRHSEQIAAEFSELALDLEPAETQDPRQALAGTPGFNSSIGALTDALGASNDLQNEGFNQ